MFYTKSLLKESISLMKGQHLLLFQLILLFLSYLRASHVSKLNMPMENVSSIFQPSLKAQRLYQKMIAFMEKYVYPAEEVSG